MWRAVSTLSDWSKKTVLDVERMEDLILVTECTTLVTPWAAVASLGRSGAVGVSLIERPRQNGINFEFNDIRGDVARHGSHFDPVRHPWYA